MSVWQWREVAPRKLAKLIRLQSASDWGMPVYVFMKRGEVRTSRHFSPSDDYVGCYTTAVDENDLIRDLIEAAFSEVGRVRAYGRGNGSR